MNDYTFIERVEWLDGVSKSIMLRYDCRKDNLCVLMRLQYASELVWIKANYARKKAFMGGERMMDDLLLNLNFFFLSPQHSPINGHELLYVSRQSAA